MNSSHFQNSSFFHLVLVKKSHFHGKWTISKKTCHFWSQNSGRQSRSTSWCFLPIFHWHRICTSSQYCWEKLFVYLNDDIFGENNHQELLNEDSNRTERGFCGHGRIQVVNSRKIRAILRYFVNFVELHLFVIT